MPSISKEKLAFTAKDDREGLNTEDIIAVFATPWNWAVGAYKTQFPDCWDVRRFETVLSDRHNTNIYDRNGVESDTDICSCNH